MGACGHAGRLRSDKFQAVAAGVSDIAVVAAQVSIVVRYGQSELIHRFGDHAGKFGARYAWTPVGAKTKGRSEDNFGVGAAQVLEALAPIFGAADSGGYDDRIGLGGDIGQAVLALLQTADVAGAFRGHQH